MIPSRPPRGLCRIASLVILLTATGAGWAPAVAFACATADECDDGDPCTGDLCDPQGVCQHEVQPFCVPCALDADCAGQDPCTAGVCRPDRTCQMTAVPGCRRCGAPGDCNDQDACTTDFCDRGACAHAAIADCPPLPEGCADGVDEDRDGLVDCDDPDCASAPECRRIELCGNCVDDDGDGRVDAEDPDCCDARTALAISRMTLRPTTVAGHANRLDVKALYAASTPPLFDPKAEDTSLQISDPRGPIFCATVAATHWARPVRRLYRFADEAGVFAGGLATGKFTVRRDGGVVFRARGSRVRLGATAGTNVLVTIRVGEQCAQDTMSLRTRRTALVFP